MSNLMSRMLFADVRNEIRSHLDPRSRIYFAWTCHELCTEDASYLLPPAFLTTYMLNEIAEFGRASIFDAHSQAFYAFIWSVRDSPTFAILRALSNMPYYNVFFNLLIRVPYGSKVPWAVSVIKVVYYGTETQVTNQNIIFSINYNLKNPQEVTTSLTKGRPIWTWKGLTDTDLMTAFNDFGDSIDTDFGRPFL